MMGMYRRACSRLQASAVAVIAGVVAVLLVAAEIRGGSTGRAGHAHPSGLLAVVRPVLAVILVLLAVALIAMAVRAVSARGVRRQDYTEPYLPYMPQEPPPARHRPASGQAVPEAALAPPPTRPVLPPGHVPAAPRTGPKQRPVRYADPVTALPGRPEDPEEARP